MYSQPHAAITWSNRRIYLATGWQATTGSSPRYAQQTTSTTSYSGTGTTGAGYSGATGAGKVLSNTTEAGRAEYPGIGGTLAPIQHAERHPLAASERQYGGVVCNRQYFTVTEDRTVLREEIQLVREHHPYEKEFIVESRPTGRERELPNTLPDDLLEASLREVDRSIPDVCEGAPVVTPANVTTSTTLQGQGIGAATTGTTATSSQYTSGTTTTGTTGTGYGATGTSGTGAGYGATSTTGSGYSGRR
ncbi:hypothetical protein WJX84_006055 [Apatococcus fuscideae]|uniref:Uncharacterized protein n=1 Tax=Apatococcus fuscideae TaxID=2026836 RepID=A0AAW1SNY5_9CHLO